MRSWLCIQLTVVLVLFAIIAHAQQCTGSVGDPIVDVTFGSGSSGIAPPLPAGSISDLQYIASTCPNDGYYSIVSNTSSCFSGGWHTAADHTGNGYFMLINASFQPSDFYIQTIGGLCEGTSYEFAAWIMNMCDYPSILPNITMNIEKTDGTVLATYNTGDIPVINPATWVQYGFDFTLPAGISQVVLRMRNNAPGGTGNDLGLDDITFRPVGPSITASIAGISGDTARVCQQQQTGLVFQSAVGPCYSSIAYLWQTSADSGSTWNDIPGAVTGSYDRPTSPPGMYMYRLVAAPSQNISLSACRVASAPVVVQVLTPPRPTLGADTFFCKQDSLVLSPGDFTTYAWMDGSTGKDYTVKEPGLYYVNVTNFCGAAQARITVTERDCNCRFPNAFTPGKAGPNEKFMALHGYEIDEFHLSVCNRWGEVVFSTDDVKAGWDGSFKGSPAPAGVYIWYCDYRTRGKREGSKVKGILTLIR